MASLSGPRRNARSGRTRSLVILLHGYGADGNDLIGLAEPLSHHLPDTVFRAPNAPERCVANAMGYQWFPIPWMDGSAESAMRASFHNSCAVLDDWLDAVLAEEGVSSERTAVVGFSQGTMMALSVLPRRSEPVAGIVGFSGRLADESALSLARSKPPVLLVHGDMDEVIPVSQLSEAASALAAAGFEVQTHVSAGIGHGIAPDGLGLALGFLSDRLGKDRSGAAAAAQRG